MYITVLLKGYEMNFSTLINCIIINNNNNDGAIWQ